VLRVELAALQEEDFSLEVIGFEDDELARLLAAQAASDGPPTKMLCRPFR
jgi:hypothetical protein